MKLYLIAIIFSLSILTFSSLGNPKLNFVESIHPVALSIVCETEPLTQATKENLRNKASNDNLHINSPAL